MKWAILLFFVVFLVGCIEMPGFPGSGASLKFSVPGCDVDDYGEPEAGVMNSEWVENTLVVDVYLKTYCKGASIAGDFVLEGNVLTLLYSVTGREMDCVCAHKLVYEFSSLEKKEYDIRVERV